MLNGFRQGIVNYPYIGSLQTFLARSGNDVSLVTNFAPVNYTIAQGTSNFLFTEDNSVTGAWTNISATQNTWLYWDINVRTGVRTFGSTTVAPVAQSSTPESPAEGQHWYDTSAFRHYVFTSGRWVEVLRVFAAMVYGNTFTPLGTGASQPFAGSQIGTFGLIPAELGRIIFDDTGLPVRKSSGEFFTTVTQAFTDASLINTLRVEATVMEAQAVQNIAEYQVVKYTAFNQVAPANYNDVQQTAIAMALKDTQISGVTPLCMQGVITNPTWNWPTVGVALWVADGGELTSSDPNQTDPVNYPTSRPPVARVLSQTQIFFDQGLGGKGDRGSPGVSPSVTKASNSVIGTTLLSVEPVNADFPIAVGDNDPRLTGPRVPTAHTHVPTSIITYPVSGLTGDNLQEMLTQIGDNLTTLADVKFDKTGGTLTGPVTTAVPITSPTQLVTKQYVDSSMTPISVPAGALAYGNTDGSLTGASSYQLAPLSATTTNDVMTSLTMPAGTIGIPIAQNSVTSFNVTLMGRSTGGNVVIVKYDAAVKRDNEAATIVLLGNTSPSIVYDDVVSTTWYTDIVADVNTAVLTIRVRGALSTTINWVANTVVTTVKT